MRRRGSREVFGPEVGLRVRMWIALALNAVFLLALLAGLAWLFVSVFWGPLAVIVFVALALSGASVSLRRWHKYMLPRQRAARVERAVARLCLVGDLERPVVVLIEDDTPLSWTTALPGQRPRLHVTTGMAQLRDAELDAVLAHELSHIGNRDATLMLAADHGAAMLTGSPAALASALARLSDGLRSIPSKDLRAAAAGDVLHILPARPPRGPRIWATHPPLAHRIACLERLEARLQA